MSLKALHIISGVTVERGKGKGTNTAQPGDIFSTDKSTEDRLVEENAAARLHEESVSSEASHRGPDVVTGTSGVESVAERTNAVLEKGETVLTANTEKSTKPTKPETAKQKAAREKKEAEAAAKKAAETKTDENVDDLGLGDDNGEEETVE